MTNRLRSIFRCTRLCFFVLNCTLSSAVFAQSPAETTATNTPQREVKATATLNLANREICTFASELDGYSPEERVAAANARLHSVLATARTMLVTTQAVTNGIQICLDKRSLFVITPGDVFTIRGQTLESKAGKVADSLREALHEMQSFSKPGDILKAIARALLGFVYFGALFWIIGKAKHSMLAWSAKLAAEKTKKVKLRGLRTEALRGFVAVCRALLNFGSYLFIALLVYALLWHELLCFPYSRPWGEYLRSRFLEAFGNLGNSAVNALPNLMVVVLIVLGVRMLVQVISRFFDVAERGEFQHRLVDPAIVHTTRRILVWFIWIVAAVVAYPYIPGSQSLAFKGITVFAGVVVSLGSSNLVNQIASGLLLIYSRAVHVGDYVKVGQMEGTVTEIGTCMTRIKTIKNEEVQIANNLLVGAATINYSRLAQKEGLLLPVKVTIGYGTPWRQVEAMLLEAARRTSGVASDPQPYVLQIALSDFYVEYELNAGLEVPEQRAFVLSALHRHIQDEFNKYGVQIMSPHYMVDPQLPHVVPQAKWFPAPAKETDGEAKPTGRKEEEWSNFGI